MAKIKDGKKNEKSNVKATGGSKLSEQANAPFPPDETQSEGQPQNEVSENDIKSEEKQPAQPEVTENITNISESQPSSEIPANAPEVTTETEEKQAQTESEGTGQSISEVATPPDATTQYSPFDAPVKAKNISGEVENSTDNNNINPPADVTPADAPVSEVENIVPVAPTQDELEERVFEKWWIGRNRPTEVNHFELANDINMNKFSSYEATVGKFKFKRSHAGANWQITVDEKK